MDEPNSPYETREVQGIQMQFCKRCNMAGGHDDDCWEKQVDALRAENAELRVRAEAAAWRPIETAPKEEEVLLICNRHRTVGWFNGQYWVGRYVGELIRPTLWMPLPAAPDQKGES